MTQPSPTPRRARPHAARAVGFIRRARLAVVVAGALCAAPPGFAEPPAPVRVLTFNILSSYLGADKAGGEETARVKRWEKRAPLVIEVMRDHPGGSGPYDFIGTQETSIDRKDPARDQTIVLAGALPEYGSLFEPCTGRAALNRLSMSNMILWRKARWQIDHRDRGTFWLSDTPETPGSFVWADVPGSYAEEDGGRKPVESRRVVTYALFHEIGAGGRTGRRVYLYNTHLSVRSDAVREKSAALIMARIAARRDKTAAVLLTGDFNARPGSPVVRRLSGAGAAPAGQKTVAAPPALFDTYAAVHPGQAGLGPASPRDLAPPLIPGKIDYIFASAHFRAVSARRIETRRGGIWPSDHYPFEAVLEFAGDKN
jgi:endonuclease/exonuclease/phosphatase family metal-dependent hydrolase